MRSIVFRVTDAEIAEYQRGVRFVEARIPAISITAGEAAAWLASQPKGFLNLVKQLEVANFTSGTDRPSAVEQQRLLAYYSALTGNVIPVKMTIGERDQLKRRAGAALGAYAEKLKRTLAEQYPAQWAWYRSHGVSTGGLGQGLDVLLMIAAVATAGASAAASGGTTAAGGYTAGQGGFYSLAGGPSTSSIGATGTGFGTSSFTSSGLTTSFGATGTGFGTSAFTAGSGIVTAGGGGGSSTLSDAVSRIGSTTSNGTVSASGTPTTGSLIETAVEYTETGLGIISTGLGVKQAFTGAGDGSTAGINRAVTPEKQNFGTGDLLVMAAGILAAIALS
jgi:hypothetical protein